MTLCIIGVLLVLAFAVMMTALVRAGSYNKEEESEDVPGCDYDYGEPPYNSYKYN